MKERFVISLTTLPPRLPFIKPVIESILKYNSDIDKLYICLPYGKVDKKYIPENTEKVQVIRCKDYGPITKILGVLDVETEPETLILTLDDDILITKNLTKIYREKAERYQNAVLSMSGWCYGEFPFNFQLVIDNEKDKYVDWVQGVHSILYRRKYLNRKKILEYEKDNKLLFKNDDHKISAYLETRKINRIVINKNPYNYFKNYAVVSSINPISGSDISKSLSFWNDVWSISEKFKRKKIYYRSSSAMTSMTYYPLFAIILFIVLLIIVYFAFLQNNFNIFILIFFILLIIIIIYYLIRYNTKKYFLKTAHK